MVDGWMDGERENGNTVGEKREKEGVIEFKKKEE